MVNLWQVRPSHSILQNPEKTAVLPVLPLVEALSKYVLQMFVKLGNWYKLDLGFNLIDFYK